MHHPSPTLSSSALALRDQQAVWHPFTPLKSGFPILPLTHAQGAYLYTEDGRAILDVIASWWVNLHGHSHPHLARAVAEQAGRLEHVIFAGFTHEPAIRLAERLLSLLPGPFGKVFYSDNGSTATEVALKMALQYFYNQGSPRRRIVAFEGAYHGDTFGAMSVGDRGAFTTPFDSHLFEVDFLPLPTGTAQDEALVFEPMEQYLASGQVAAFIFEPLVQGAAGMRMYPAAALDRLMQMAQQAGALCIADEVMTGFGRTGTLFACQQLSARPDIICLSKGLTGGMMALGVTAVTDRVQEAFRVEDFMKTFFHGHSFTANPLACAAANASLDLLLAPECAANRERIAQAHQQAARRFARLPFLENIRQAGTILAMDYRTYEHTSYVNEARGRLYTYFLDQNLLLRPLGNVLYLLPPYIMTNPELERVYAAIEALGEQVG